MEWTGEFVDRNAVNTGAPLVAEDGSVAPTVSRLKDPTYVKLGVVAQIPNGWFLHAGFNYSQGIGDRTVGGQLFRQQPIGIEASIGWHPGTKVYVPPPPPEPVIREVVREVPAPARIH